MHLVRNRLLFLLVLLSIALGTVASTAQAGVWSFNRGASTAVTISRPAVHPTSGDPDSPQNGGKATPNYSSWRDSAPRPVSWGAWMSWTGRFWMVRYLGVK